MPFLLDARLFNDIIVKIDIFLILSTRLAPTTSLIDLKGSMRLYVLKQGPSQGPTLISDSSLSIATPSKHTPWRESLLNLTRWFHRCRFQIFNTRTRVYKEGLFFG